jgi:hypothetical protein
MCPSVGPLRPEHPGLANTVACNYAFCIFLVINLYLLQEILRTLPYFYKDFCVASGPDEYSAVNGLNYQNQLLNDYTTETALTL